MGPKWLLRTAAILLGIFFLGHTVGGMLLGKSRGFAEDAVLGALRTYHFELMGFERSHMDFYTGEGWYLSLTLAVLIIIIWQLSNAAAQSPALVRGLLIPLTLFCAGSTALCVMYFFTAPIVASALSTVVLAAAWLRLRP